MQKARRHATLGDAPTACGRTVSGTLSLLCMRCFSPFPHGTCSLSVSCHIFSLAGWSRRIHTGFHVSRATQGAAAPGCASCTGLSPSTGPLSSGFHSHFRYARRGPATPAPPRRRRFGLLPVRSPLLGESLTYFLLLRVLRCFSSPRAPPANTGWQPFRLPGCPIRKSADQRPFAPTRGLSQLVTSFIACRSQGILRTPFSTFPHTPRIKAGRRVSGTLSRPRRTSPKTMGWRPVSLVSFALSVSVCQRSDRGKTAGCGE